MGEGDGVSPGRNDARENLSRRSSSPNDFPHMNCLLLLLEKGFLKEVNMRFNEYEVIMFLVSN